MVYSAYKNVYHNYLIPLIAIDCFCPVALFFSLRSFHDVCCLFNVQVAGTRNERLLLCFFLPPFELATPLGNLVRLFQNESYWNEFSVFQSVSMSAVGGRSAAVFHLDRVCGVVRHEGSVVQWPCPIDRPRQALSGAVCCVEIACGFGRDLCIRFEISLYIVFMGV